MIEILLVDKTNDLINVALHPEYVDFPVRDSRSQITEARLEIAAENFVAPIVAGLNRKTAIETYPDLMRAANEIAQRHPRREDGKRVIAFLLAWGHPHPQARWHVAGAESVARTTRFIERASMPRLSATSLTADPLARGVRFIGEAARMDEIDADDDLDRLLQLGPGYEEISGAMLLQREVRIQPTGGGTKGRIKKDPPPSSATIREKSRRQQQEDGLEAREVFGVRIPTYAKTALQQSGVAPELIAALGRAIASGRTLEDIRLALVAETVPDRL